MCQLCWVTFVDFALRVGVFTTRCSVFHRYAKGKPHAVESIDRSSYSVGSGGVVVVCGPVRCRRWNRRHVWYDAKRTSWYQREAGRCCYGSYGAGGHSLRLSAVSEGGVEAGGR